MRVIDIHECQPHLSSLVKNKRPWYGKFPCFITVERGQIDAELLLVDEARRVRHAEDQAVPSGDGIAYITQHRESQLLLLGVV